MKRHRVIDPSKARAAAMGGFYTHIPEPAREKCSRCGEMRINVQDGTCCYCKRPRRKD